MAAGLNPLAWAYRVVEQPAAQAAHTPTLYTHGGLAPVGTFPLNRNGTDKSVIYSNRGKYFASTFDNGDREMSAENAALLILTAVNDSVAAVNTHASLTAERDQLRAALARLVDSGLIASCTDGSGSSEAHAELWSRINEARAALALASTEGGKNA